jgi:hypothetical protein
MRTVTQLIADAGGARAIALASESTPHTIGFDAVYKWPKIGVPERHWPLLISLAAATVQEIYDANRMTERDAPVEGAAA